MKTPRGYRGAILFALIGTVGGAAGCGKGSSGDTGPAGPAGAAAAVTPIVTQLDRAEDLPGAVLAVTGLSGSSSPFRTGNTISITFTLKKGDGTALPLSEMDSTSVWVAGPTFNYQHLLPAGNTSSYSDIKTAAVQNSDGSYTYTLPDAIPATYGPPLYDTTRFSDGELTGQTLLAGTYTVAMRMYKNYTINGVQYRDVANVMKDFIYGDVAAEAPRQVVTTEGCNRCHSTLQMHGGGYRKVELCITCHTAGAEDRNSVAGATDATPITIDFKVMIHKIHNGKHLPSVLGVGTNADGTRNYAATPTPYQVGGRTVHDYSEIGFPVFPSAYHAFLYDQAGTTYQGVAGNGPMPKDAGFSALTAAQKRQDDGIRTGVVACAKCHGDPDDSGPLTAPAQGGLAYSQPSRQACGSCHDDIDWTKPYTANGLTMPPQADDSQCATCHVATGTATAGNPPSTESAHLHPYNNSALNTGVALSVTAVAGGTGAAGKHQAGDPFTVTFSVKDDAGANRQIHTLTRLQMIVAGPTHNTHLILPNINAFDFSFRKSDPFTGNGTIGKPTVGAAAVAQTLAIVFTGVNTFDVIGSVSGNLAAGLVVPDGGGNTGDLTHAGVTFKITDGSTNFAAGDRWYLEVVPTADTYTVNVPVDITYERVGAATGGADVLTVGNLPLYWGRQVVQERTVINAGTVIGAAATAQRRFVVADKANLDAAGIAVGDKVVLDAGTAGEEYLEVKRIQTTNDTTGADLGAADQVWFGTALRYNHAAGAALQEVTLTKKREGIHYTVTNPAAGTITLTAGQFTAGNPVVVNYRTDGRFGWRRAPGDALQSVYPAAFFGTDDFDVTWGDWKNLALVDGTYTVGLWASKDFTVKPDGTLAASTEGWNNFTSENTTYRMMARPATKTFLFGGATATITRAVVSSGDNCNTCHDDIAFHGFGRRGLDTCLLCHTMPGAEDAAKYAYNSWYVGPTPGVTIDFRQLIHKVHRGKELANAATYVVNGVFLGTPFETTVDEIGFSAMPGGAKHCATCHGSSNTAWKEPDLWLDGKTPDHRRHPTAQTQPLRSWRSACGSCHDGDSATAHMTLNTSAGMEACATCHGVGKDYNVELMHKNR